MFDNSKATEINVIHPAKKTDPTFPGVPGCEFIKMENTSNDKGKSVTFTFRQRSTGGILGHREFEPTQKKDQTPEKFKTQVGLVTSRIAHICHAFLPEAEAKAIKGETWDEYIRAVAVALQVSKENGFTPMKAKGIEATLKVVYREDSGKYYSSFPGVPPFISTSIRPKEFTVDPNYDKFEKVEIKPDTEKAKAQGADSFGGGNPPPATQTASSNSESGF